MLKCPTNKNLNIINASYGRTDQITCPALPIYTKNTNCVSNQTQFLIKQCNNKNSCLVPNSSLIFGDPCIDTFKYLGIIKFFIVFNCQLFNLFYFLDIQKVCV